MNGNVNFQATPRVESVEGRVAMYADAGYLDPECVKFPDHLSTSASLKFAEGLDELSAISKVPVGGWVQ